MKQQIKHRYNDKVLFECELADGTVNPIREAVINAVASGASLNGANLDGANLNGVNLYRANLDGANLNGANLDGANLDGASLYRANLNGASLCRANLNSASLNGANLDGANLNGVNLYGANLDGASLNGASLKGANLDCASLNGASLDGANLNGANLDGASLYRASLYRANLNGASLCRANLNGIKGDFWMVLLSATPEISGLRLALVEGRVDGSTYQGDCACLVGTIANIRHADYQEIGIKPDSNRASERWFMGIKKGDTPETNQVSKLTVEWLDEFVVKLNLAKAVTA